MSTPDTSTPFCGRCGLPLSGSVPHPACEQALRLEPPRYCPSCRRRMVVQVTPDGWTARCVEHGSLHQSTWVT